jgi:hypothetical protein
MKAYILVFLAFIFFSHANLLGGGLDNINCTGIDGISVTNLDFSKWNLVLNKYVKSDVRDGVSLNVVDYSGMYSDGNYSYFLCQLQASNTSNFTEPQWYAFWINAYNALAIYAIVQNPCKMDLFGSCSPLTSIENIGLQQPTLWFSNFPVWDQKLMKFGGVDFSLNDIEHRRLRFVSFPNPNGFKRRVELHASIVCASISCPNLRNESYTPENLDAQLQSNTEEFLANRLKGSAVSGDDLTLSQIFGWFNDDFMNQTKDATATSNFPNLSSFLLKYTNNTKSKDIYNYVISHPDVVNQNKFKKFTYKWELNGEINSSLCNANRLCISYIYLIVALGVIGIVVIVVIVIVKRKKNYQKI